MSSSLSLASGSSSKTTFSFSTTVITPLSTLGSTSTPAPPAQRTASSFDADDFCDDSGNLLSPFLIADLVNARLRSPPSTTPAAPSLSIRDIQASRDAETKGITPPIAKSHASFVRGLYQLIARRRNFPAWQNAASIIMHRSSPDGSQTADVTVDLLVRFHDVDPADLLVLAEDTWSMPTARSLAIDGISLHYCKKSFADLLFNSMDLTLQSLVQNLIPAHLWNDGPYVWIRLVKLVFPSSEVFRLTIHDDLASLTVPAAGDITSYTNRFREGLLLLATEPDMPLYKSFFAQMLAHPSPIFQQRFRDLSLRHYASRADRLPLLDMLSEADELQILIGSNSLPLQSTPPNPGSRITDDSVLALAASIQTGHTNSKDMLALVQALQDRIKSLEGNKQLSNRPTWYFTAPDDINETREHGSNTWHWCAKCRRGQGQWSTTHSTNGNPASGIAAHVGGNPNRFKKHKHQSSPPSRPSPSIAALKTSMGESAEVVTDLLARFSAPQE